MPAENAIPTIDLTALRTGGEAGRRDVARQIDEACRDTGFFLVAGHGVPTKLITAARQRAIDFIRREVEAARGNGLNARLLVPLTRGHGDGAALQFEVELQKLDQLDQFRNRGIGSSKETGSWMHAFSEVLTAPPAVVILHVDGAEAK